MALGINKKGGASFDAEVARVHAAGLLGESGRLRELFDFLAARGPGAPSASQAEIADTVFGQADGGSDDATVRVYIHRLRKRLDEFYAANDASAGRLVIPAGAYALRLNGEAETDAPVALVRRHAPWLALGLAVLLGLAGAFYAGRALAPSEAPVNALWEPVLESARPKLIVVGDYYMFGEIDHVTPEKGRLIRDFRVNSATDLARLQEEEPQRYGTAEDVGLNYLPFSTAYGIQAVAPILAERGREVSVIAASALEPEMLNRYDVIYVGLFSGMALLEDINFMNSNFGIGESYDELVDSRTGKAFVSEEAHNLPSPVYYNDYGYVSRFRAPGGAWVVVVAGARDTGLRAMAPLATRAALTAQVENLAEDGNFEAVYQITGQKGADVSERLLEARARK